ncbi:alpha/beta fold hydrolase [Rhodococcus aetherivorans]
MRDRLPLLTCPLHLVVGADDPWLDPDAVADLAVRINDISPGRARFTRLDGVGHYPMEEVEDFAVLADSWLTDLRGATAEVLS